MAARRELRGRSVLLVGTTGGLVGVSSLAAGRGFAAGTAYCPSKAGVSVLFECLRTDLTPPGISVHLAEPGFFTSGLSGRLSRTPFIIPARRAAEELLAGVERGRFRIRYPGKARLYAALLRALPDPLFDKLMGAGHPVRKISPSTQSRQSGDPEREADGRQ